MGNDDDLRAAAAAISGTSPSGSGSSAPSSHYDDDITPFPSPMLSARSLAGLSRESCHRRHTRASWYKDLSPTRTI